MNKALSQEGVNASGGVEHPPFHFDFLDVTCGTENAHAFQHGSFWFIVLTVPLVVGLWNLSERLSAAKPVQHLLGFDPGTLNQQVLQNVLFQLQLNFVVSHEYTHLIHGHLGACPAGQNGVWTEFGANTASGGIDLQVQELDADGYAIYLGLAYFLHGDLRHRALTVLNRDKLTYLDAEQMLMTCFFFVIMAFFCYLWRGAIDVSSVYRFTHPPPPIRIKNAIQIARMWCGQNESLPPSWFDEPRFRPLFSAVAELMPGPSKQTWDAPMTFLQSQEGRFYEKQLFDAFDVVRTGRTNE